MCLFVKNFNLNVFLLFLTFFLSSEGAIREKTDDSVIPFDGTRSHNSFGGISPWARTRNKVQHRNSQHLPKHKKTEVLSSAKLLRRLLRDPFHTLQTQRTPMASPTTSSFDSSKPPLPWDQPSSTSSKQNTIVHQQQLCIIADIFGWTASVAKELGVFHVIFSSYGLASGRT